MSEDTSRPGPIDVDVNALDPEQFAQLLISRGIAGDDAELAEIHRDVATRYRHNGEAVLVLIGIVEQLLDWVGSTRGMTAAELWRDMLLRRAIATGDDGTEESDR